MTDNPYGWPQERIDLLIERHKAGLSRDELAREFGVGGVRISMLRRCLQLQPVLPPKRPAPDDFREVVAAVGVAGARRRYGIGWDTFARWAGECKVDINGAPTLLPVPPGFEDFASHNFKKTTAAHFKLSPYKVTRLLEQTNITPRRFAGSVPVPPPSSRAGQKGGDYFTPTMPIVSSDAASRAAHYLRKIYGNVHRCDLRLHENGPATWGTKHGVPDAGRGYYHVDGAGNITNAELIALARKKGFSQ